MRKLLKVSDYVLLIAAFASDAFTEIRSGFGIMPAALNIRYGFVPQGHKKSSYKTTVSRMLSVGDLNKIISSNGQAVLEITPKGMENFKRKFPLMDLKRKKWDGYFMLAIFDIPEVQRNDRYIVRAKLEALGFAMLQESVWISPYHFEADLREFFVNNGLSQKVLIMEAKNIYSGNLQDTVKKIWKLEQLNNSYNEIIVRSRKVSNLNDAEKNEETKNILNIYLQTLKFDPMLPEEIDSLKNTRLDAGIALRAIMNS